uniref:C2H2-type domain-containing protein n=1 Tax=Meloidogyne javanica TaxID=6303 RepID=A0A915N2Y4_MELJA
MSLDIQNNFYINLGEVTKQQYKKCRFCNNNFKKEELGLHLLLAHKDGAPTSSGGQGESSSSIGTLGQKRSASRSASLSPSKKKKCSPCNTTITIKNFNQHLQTPKHKKMARLAGVTDEAGGSSLQENK